LSTPFEQFPLHPALLPGLERNRFTAPTPLQAHVIPQIFDGRDMIVQAKPGSGQTLAYGLPILSLLDPDQKPQALVLTANRDRCMQIWDTLSGLGAETGLDVQALHSGFALAMQEKALRRRVDVVVGTPGRVKDLVANKRLDLARVRMIVLDNAEELYYEGLRREVEFLMERCTGREQTLIFTEEMPDALAALAKRFLADPELVRLTNVAKADRPVAAAAPMAAPAPGPASAEGLFYVRLGDEDALERLVGIMKAETPKRALIYAASRQELKRVAQQVERATGLRCGSLTRDMSPHARNSMLGRFRAGDHRVLVVHQQVDAEIEVDELTHVFHLDMPEGELDASSPIAGAAPHRKTILLIPADGEAYLAALCQRAECSEYGAMPPAVPAPAPRKAAAAAPARSPAAGPEREPRRRNRLGATRAPAHGRDPGALLTQAPEERTSTGPLAPLPRMRMSWETFKVALNPGRRPSRDSVHAWLADSTGIPRSCLRSIVVFADHVTVEVESKEIEKFRAGFQDKLISS
jgi:ATP-dependent RNA helicase DeaD